MAPTRSHPFAGRTVRLALCAAALGVAAGGCAIGGARPRNPFEGEATRRIRIDVTNRNYSDATLHAYRGGQRYRLGTVIGNQEASYQLDWPQGLPLQIEIRLLAGPSCITRPLQVQPGDIVQLQIETDLARNQDCVPRGTRTRPAT